MLLRVGDLIPVLVVQCLPSFEPTPPFFRTVMAGIMSFIIVFSWLFIGARVSFSSIYIT